MSQLKNFINGKFVDVDTTATVNAINPATEEIISKVPLSTSKEVDEAVEIAKGAFPHWSGLTFKQRAGIMFKFHSLIDLHSEELAQIIVR